MNCVLPINIFHALNLHPSVLRAAPLLLTYERDVGGRSKGPTAKELSLSAAVVGTIVRNALTGKAWFLPGKKTNGNGYHRSHAHPQGEPQLLKKEEQFSLCWLQ